MRLQSARETSTDALQSREELAPQAIDATLDTRDPLGLVDVEHLAVHPGGEQHQLPESTLDGLFLPARVDLARRKGEAGDLGHEDRQRGLEVLRRDVREGEHGQRAREERRQLMFALHVPDGVVGMAGEVVRECRVVCGPGPGLGAGRRRLLVRPEVLDDADGRLEDARLHDLDPDIGRQRREGPSLGRQLLVDLAHGDGELPTDGDPLDGLEVVVLEQHHER